MIPINKILLLEDDTALCQGITLALQSETIEIVSCHSKQEAVNRLSGENFDLAIFDINLPDGNGLDLLREERTKGHMAIILLTAKDTEMDIVSGLESGADDYITKPFSLAVLRARVHTQLKRKAEHSVILFHQADFQFDFEHMEFYKGKDRIEFSKTEQKLLRYLVENRGMTLPRKRLLELIWPDGTDYVDENALSVAVKRLRDKLEDTPSKPEYIKTVYGIGYCWVTNYD